jgi:hypothetical protein
MQFAAWRVEMRCWSPGHDWDALRRLHARGLIGDSVNKAKSLVLAEEGLRQSERLFRQYFERSRPRKQS